MDFYNIILGKNKSQDNNSNAFSLDSINGDNILKLGVFFYDLYCELSYNKSNIDKKFYNSFEIPENELYDRAMLCFDLGLLEEEYKKEHIINTINDINKKLYKK